MKKWFFFIIFCFNFVFASSVYASVNDADHDGLTDQEERTVYHTDPLRMDTDHDGYADAEEILNGYAPTKSDGARLTRLVLPVPYIHEAPDGAWVGPWKNACEESSVAMVDAWYRSQTSLAISDAKSFMWKLFLWENAQYGSNADTDARRTSSMVHANTSFQVFRKENPTIEEIRAQIRLKRPVISFHYGFTLNNRNIPFSRRGSYYHVLVIVGYDDATGSFITNDPGDQKEGRYRQYSYTQFMRSLHDFNHTTKKADGPATVLFTAPLLVRIVGSERMYTYDGTALHYVPSLSTLKKYNLQTRPITELPQDWMSAIPEGAPL